MKSIILVLVATILSFTQLNAQDKNSIQTDTFRVEGVCGSCKKRIENAAYIPGVKSAEWNQESSMLTVSYKSKKVSKDEIVTAITEKGHTADGKKANKEAYDKLPKCCAYDDGVEKH